MEGEGGRSGGERVRHDRGRSGRRVGEGGLAAGRGKTGTEGREGRPTLRKPVRRSRFNWMFLISP